VAYADDVVLLVTGPFLDTICNIMEGALKKLSDWAKSFDLGVNPTRTELMLFTKKTKIPNFNLPRLNGLRLHLSHNAKYLGVILNPKLSWKLKIEERVGKACIAYYFYKKAFSKTWGLHPKIYDCIQR